MTYDYYCPKCDDETEGEKKLDDPNPFCEKCKTQLEIKICASPIRFKGAGFTVNDYDKDGAYEY